MLRPQYLLFRWTQKYPYFDLLNLLRTLYVPLPCPSKQTSVIESLGVHVWNLTANRNQNNTRIVWPFTSISELLSSGLLNENQ
jgi:hypothetical protein